MLAVVAVLGLGYEMRSILGPQEARAEGRPGSDHANSVPAAIAGGIGVLAVVALLLTYVS